MGSFFRMPDDWNGKMIRGLKAVLGDVSTSYTTDGNVYVRAPASDVDVYAFRDHCPPHELKLIPIRSHGTETYELQFYKVGKSVSRTTLMWNMLLTISLLGNALFIASSYNTPHE